MTMHAAEKVLFEWKISEAINHGTDSVKANTFFNDFFVGMTRKSNHVFDEGNDKDLLIYNYDPVYTEDVVSDFEQCYFFKKQ